MQRTAMQRIQRIATVWLAGLSWMATGAAAEDRKLLRLTQSGTADPFVFVIFDTSASMVWTPACTQADTFDDVDPFDAHCTQECTLDNTTCSRLCPSYGCREYVILDPDNPVNIPLNPAGGDDIWIDNDDPEVTLDPLVVTPSGLDGWAEFTAPTGYKGDNFYLTNYGTDITTPLRTVTYDPDITTAGTYMIFMSWVAASNAGTNIMVDVSHKDGTDTVTSTVTVDQTSTVDLGAGSTFNGWNLLGTYELDAATGTVVLRNESANNLIIADAVRWLRIDVAPCVDDSDKIWRCQQPICPDGDCYAPLNGDDPTSKLYQAKQAVYEVIDAVDSVNFGFASFEQDNARLHAKHWLYRVREDNPLTGNPQTLPTFGITSFLEVGDDEVFGNYSTSGLPGGSAQPGIYSGDGWDCVRGSEDARAGCDSSNPVDLTDLWEMERARRIPKLGFDGSRATNVWYRKDYTDGEWWVAQHADAGFEFGDDPFGANVNVFYCSSGVGCAFQQSLPVYYDLVSDYAAVEGETERQPMTGAGYFDVQKNLQALDGKFDLNSATNDDEANPKNDVSTCHGLELNDDSDFDVNGNFEDDPVDAEDDLWWDYSLKWPTTTDARGDDYDFDGTADTPRVDHFDVGDFIPLDWTNSNADELQRRLAPNLVRGTDPLDFRVAKYFESELETPPISNNKGTQADEPWYRRLRLANDETDGDETDDERPLVASGRTPLGESLADFKIWYSGLEGDDPDDLANKGWSDFAQLADPDFSCRKKIVLMLTDGVDSCHEWCENPRINQELPDPLPADWDPASDDQCVMAGDERFANDPVELAGALLNDEGFQTYVVGFGVKGGAGLEDIADAGGTEDPLLPRNKDELVTALENILEDVQAEQRAFASASIPALQSTAADKIFLSSFTPIPYEDYVDSPPDEPAPGFWPGRIDAFRKPLPLTSDNRPDVDRPCDVVDMASADLQSGCHVWEAGQILCEQEKNDTRTVIYGFEDTEGDDVPGGARPGLLSEFKVPEYLIDNPSDGYDPTHPDFPLVEDLAKIFLEESPRIIDRILWAVYKVPVFGFSFDNEDIYNRLSDVVDKVGLKDLPLHPDGYPDLDGCDRDDNGDVDSFVLGDVFHASPVAISGPSNFTYFANDLCGPVQRTDIPNNCVSPDDLRVDENRGYRQFAADHVWRRRMLAAATNDGQIHFFDTGVRQLVDNDFTPSTTDQIELFNDGGGKEMFSYIPRMILPVLREQAIDGLHIYSMDGSITIADAFIDPVDPLGGTAEPLDRNWRTVMIAGMREAGDVHKSNDRVTGFKSGYVALDITQPDILIERPDGSTDPTLVPCQVETGCTESLEPAAEYAPSCLGVECLHPVHKDSKEPIDPVTFPAELWTFRDSWLIEHPANSDEFIEYYLDEDSDGADSADSSDDDNGYFWPDLADTWSRPVIGQVAVCPTVGGANCEPGGTGLETRHVAIFGGGMDAESKTAVDASDLQGAYLYMVDVETGLPIYKHRLGDGTGAAPSDPAVLDENQDGIFDAVYIGTTDGYLYKVDLTALAGTKVPGLASVTFANNQLIRDDDGDGDYDTTYEDDDSDAAPAITTTRVIDAAWAPFPILDTGTTVMGVRTPSPIYFPPSLFFIPERDQFGLALGTGDREDLWSPASDGGHEAKFFVIVDEDFKPTDYDPSAGNCVDRLPFDETCMVSFSFTADPLDDFDLLTGTEVDASTSLPMDIDTVSELMRPGWSMRFDTSDSLQNRVITEAFVISGVVIFSVFDPNTVTVTPAPGDPPECRSSGTTRAFVVLASNGAPVTNLTSLGGGGGGDDDDDDLTATDRYHEISEFTTAPFIERTATKNDPSPSGRTLDDLLEGEVNESVRSAIMGYLPRGSRFNDAYKVVIAALRNSTGVSVYAEIPIAVYPADWRDQ